MSSYLIHHGIRGQKWGVRNGPPYPLERPKLTGLNQHDINIGKKYVDSMANVRLSDFGSISSFPGTRQPNERIPESIRETARRINHDASTNQSRRNNCAENVIAMAASLNDSSLVIEAKEREKDVKYSIADLAEECFKGFSFDKNAKDITPKAETAKEQVEKYIAKFPGKYGGVRLNYINPRDGASVGHALSWVKDGDKIVIYDTQPDQYGTKYIDRLFKAVDTKYNMTVCDLDGFEIDKEKLNKYVNSLK